MLQDVARHCISKSGCQTISRTTASNSPSRNYSKKSKPSFERNFHPCNVASPSANHARRATPRYNHDNVTVSCLDIRQMHWWIQPSFFLGGGGVTWRRDPSLCQGIPKTENSMVLGHYFWEETKFTFEKKCPNCRWSGGSPQVIENMTEVDFLCKRKTRFFNESRLKEERPCYCYSPSDIMVSMFHIC